MQRFWHHLISRGLILWKVELSASSPPHLLFAVPLVHLDLLAQT